MWFVTFSMTLMSNKLVLINVIKLNLGMGNPIGHVSAPFIMNVNCNHKFHDTVLQTPFPLLLPSSSLLPIQC
jgi:hypothetical protein